MKTVRIMVLSLLLAVHGLAWGGFNEGLEAARNGNYDTAMKEWKPLAEQGDANSQYHLGVLYHNGLGVPQDYKQAMNWYRKAAQQGLAAAQYNLGVIYHNCNSEAQNYVQAYMWFSIAIENGAAGATSNRDLTASKMTPAQITEAQRLARDWAAKYP